MRMRKRVLYPLHLFMWCLLLLMGRVNAQNQAVIRLDMPSTTLQTGQYYDVTIRIENAPQFWALDITLAYDPASVYIMGTRAGSPIAAGELFSGISAIGVKNIVEDGTLQYTISKVGETAPAEGSGVIGTFRIYPLKSGASRLQFPQLQVVGLSSYDANATDVTTQKITVAPALLDLTITGDLVEPPSEATATPHPTDEPTQSVPNITRNAPTAEPTLENIVFATQTPVPLTLQQVPEAPSNSGLLIFGAVLLALIVIGIGIMMRLRR
jgi:cohesin domain-containing protein